jgi:hypothetical protein
MARRLLLSLGVVVALIVAVVVAGTAYTALKTPLQTTPNSNLNPEACSPGPCADVQGYTIWLWNIRVDNDVVRITVKFQNSSTSTHAAPEDLVLIDSERRQGAAINDIAGCKTFGRHDFANGETFGPIDLCFRVSNPSPPFILRWSPDMGTFCCEKDITIWPS